MTKTMDAEPVAAPAALSFREILFEKREGVATVTLNRPHAYNAYSTGTLRELIAALQDATFDDAVAVIVITGAGTKSFCTGGDVKEYAETYTKAPHEYWKYMQLFRTYLEAILRSGKPTIARLNGMAVGGGHETQLACDLSVIAEHAYVGQVGTSVGSVACGGATQWLPITVGTKRAAEMLLMNPRIPARQALEWGLVNAVAPSVTCRGDFVERPTAEQIRWAERGESGYAIDLSRLDQIVASYAANLKEKFPECTRYTKQQMNVWKEWAWFSTIGHGADWLSLHFASREPWEGMQAFVEKRPPDVAGIRGALARGESPEFLWGAYRKTCPACKAVGLPADFGFCGKCGGPL